MAQGGELRNRKDNPKKKSRHPKDNEDKAQSQKPPTSTTAKDGGSHRSSRTKAAVEDETLWQVFNSHPLVIVAPYILVPVALYFALHFVVLQRPGIVSQVTFGQVTIRPAVRFDDTRQVLILGSLGSGTIPASKALQSVLKLEIRHETADATWQYTRDGTASSILGLRYSPDLSANRLSNLVDDWCLKRHSDANAFKPSMFQPTSCFSLFGKWSDCDTKECLGFVGREYGCALRDPMDCKPSYARVLHQVRHPRTVISELMSSVCPSYLQRKNTTMHPAFQQLASVYLKPEVEFQSCLESVSWYVVDFNRAMLSARQKKLIDAAYQYEESTPCDVARLAGFLDSDTVVYPPNVEKISAHCNPTAVGQAETKLTFSSLTTQKDSTRKLHSFTWEDFQDAGGNVLVNALKKLCKDLGYLPDTIPESTPNDEFKPTVTASEGKSK